jgi:FkbM family methyltransferase
MAALSMYTRFLPTVEKLLKERSPRLTFFDVGARNGLWDLPHLAPYVDAYGFEPNPKEYEKIVSGKTAPAMHGHKAPIYRSFTCFPYALSSTNGTQEFCVTPNPSASGLLEPNLERLSEITWKGRTYDGSFGKALFEGFQKISVDVRTLDRVCEEQHVPYIDFLKIDVEGSEFDVLDGGHVVLPHVGVIKVEVCFIPFRKQQKLFSDVDVLLRRFGFDLLRYEIEQVQIGYKERTAPVDYLPYDEIFADPYGQPLSADAIYVNRSITDPNRAFAQAMILLEKNYVDEALHILRTKANMTDEEFFSILRTYCDDSITQLLCSYKKEGGKAGPRFRRLGYKIVDDSIALLGKATSFFHR